MVLENVLKDYLIFEGVFDDFWCDCNFVFFGISVGSLVNNPSCYDSRHLNLTQHLGCSSLCEFSLSHILTEAFVGGIHLTCRDFGGFHY